MMTNDIRGWMGPTFSWRLFYGWRKTPKKLNQGNWFDRRSKPGPLGERQWCYPRKQRCGDRAAYYFRVGSYEYGDWNIYITDYWSCTQILLIQNIYINRNIKIKNVGKLLFRIKKENFRVLELGNSFVIFIYNT